MKHFSAKCSFRFACCCSLKQVDILLWEQFNFLPNTKHPLCYAPHSTEFYAPHCTAFFIEVCKGIQHYLLKSFLELNCFSVFLQELVCKPKEIYFPSISCLHHLCIPHVCNCSCRALPMAKIHTKRLNLFTLRPRG